MLETTIMWRAFFVAMGIVLCIVGGECLIIDKAVLAKSEDGTTAFNANQQPTGPISRDLKPPEWAPWTFISVGAVVLLYSFTIPRRVSAK